MLSKLSQKKNIVLIICAIILLLPWTLTLIFGNGEGKVILLVLSLLVPFLVYVLIKLAYKIVKNSVSPKTMRLLFYILLIVGAVGTVMMIAEYITYFPDGLTVALGACEAIIIATLDEAKKY